MSATSAQTKMLIIDEIHHILAGHIRLQSVFLNALKYLSNELRAPIVAVGTKDALRAIQTDPQMANRFEPAPLAKWVLDEEFRRLLASLERVLPLQRPSGLAMGQMPYGGASRPGGLSLYRRRAAFVLEDAAESRATAGDEDQGFLYLQYYVFYSGRLSR